MNGLLRFGKSIGTRISGRIIGRPASPQGGDGFPVFAIGLYSGKTLTSLKPVGTFQNPVLTKNDITDRNASFIADPFLTHSGGIWYLFFEVLDWKAGKGCVGMASSPDGQSFQYEGVVLEEPFHLSYPHVFQHGDEYYMVPETAGVGQVILYRSVDFPKRWVRHATILAGQPFKDSTIFQNDGYWWLLTETSEDESFGLLRLYYSASLTGPWEQHRLSPVRRNDPRVARPAGRVVRQEGQLIRFAQDCRRVYGEAVYGLKIDDLDLDLYKESDLQPEPLLGPAGKGWNGCGMHHIDAHWLPETGWLAAVDGWYFQRA